MAIMVAVLAAGGCRREPKYSQATPDEVLQSAKLMVKNGRADRLTDLIYAENADMRGLYQRLGVMMGSVQRLALALNEKFPKEVQELRAKAEKAAKEGKASSLMGRLTGEARRSMRNGGPGAGQGNPGDAMDATFKQLLADPYGWLDENSSKLTTETINDDMVAVMWDGKPVLPPIGLAMKKDGDKWYVVAPTNLPGVSGFMPKNKDEYTVFRKLIATLDNAVVELTKEVKTGKVRSLDEVSRKAGEKAFVPAAIAFLAYSQAVEARKKENRKIEAAKKEAAQAAGKTEEGAKPAEKSDGGKPRSRPKANKPESDKADPGGPGDSKPAGSKPGG